jgi:hypothetical protein
MPATPEDVKPQMLILAFNSFNALGPPHRQTLDHSPKRDNHNGCSCTPPNDAQEDPMPPHKSFDAFMTGHPGSPRPKDYNIRRIYLRKLIGKD